MGEAALQALVQAPPDKLEEEGFFDDFKTIAQRFGRDVLRAAPAVIEATLPVLRGIIATKSNSGVGAEAAIAPVSSTKAPTIASTDGVRKDN